MRAVDWKNATNYKNKMQDRNYDLFSGGVFGGRDSAA